MIDRQYLIVFVTVPDVEFGRVLGRTLVDEGLAACVQVEPSGTAIYRWEGQTHSDPMCQLIIKTRSAVWPTLMERIAGLHSDDVPEVLAVNVQDGLPAYLRWIDEVVTAK